MDWNNNQECLAAVKKNSYALQYVKNQTPEMCLVAVKKNGWTLQYVKQQTKEICLAAVKNYSLAFQFIDKNKFPELYCYYKLLNN